MEMGSRVFSLRLDDGLIDRLDAVCGDRGRNGFIRDAIEAALGGFDADVSEYSVGSSEDRVFGLLLMGPRGVCGIADVFGWPVDYADQVVRQLVIEGRVRVDGDFYYAV